MIQVQMPEGARIPGDPAASGTLDDVRPRECARVRGVRGDPLVRRRLMEMGFVSGTHVRIVRLAPFGDPMEVELHGYHVSLRRSEARTILVGPC
jgi:ferrous iron transport protein A